MAAINGNVPSLWLLRHAIVPQAQGRCYGASDWPACPTATAQAAQAALAQLQQWQQQPLALHLYASPLGRCQQLAQALQALHPSATLHTDPRLCEMDFGTWEGRLWSSLYAADFAPWMADFAHQPPAPGAESVATVMQRVRQAWQDWAAQPPPGITLWMTHAGVIRAAQLLAQGVAYPANAEQWPATAVAYGGLWRWATLGGVGEEGRLSA